MVTDSGAYREVDVRTIDRVVRNPVMTFVMIVGGLILLDIGLLMAGYRVLIAEQLSSDVIVERSQFGEGYKIDTLECSYFTGRSIKVESVSQNLIDECPFIFKPNNAERF